MLLEKLVETRLRRLVVAAVAAVGVVLAASPAFAGGEKSLESVLGDIQWGDSKDEVLDKLKSQMLRKIRQRKDLRHDRVKMQQARKEAMRKYDRIKESYTELEGEDSGYRVSVISNEFTRDNNEALLKVEDQAAQRFYFFVDGAFYKLVVAYKQGYLEGVGFKSFVGQVAGKYGQPEETKSAEVNGEETMVRARWSNASTTLRAKNQREFFGTFSLVFSDRQRIKQMKAQNEKFGGSEKSAADVSERVESLKEGSDKDENADVVDDMIGEKVELDMKRNAKLEDQGPSAEENRKKKREREEKEAADRQERQAQASGGDDEQEEEEEKDREFKNLEADKKKGDDDELIVY